MASWTVMAVTSHLAVKEDELQGELGHGALGAPQEGGEAGVVQGPPGPPVRQLEQEGAGDGRVRGPEEAGGCHLATRAGGGRQVCQEMVEGGRRATLLS